MLQHIKLPVSALRRCLHPLLKETGRGEVVGTLAGRAEVRWAGDPPKASLPTPGVTPGRGAWGGAAPRGCLLCDEKRKPSHLFHPRTTRARESVVTEGN